MKQFIFAIVFGLIAFNPLAMAKSIAPSLLPVAIESAEIVKPVAIVDGVVINLVQTSNGGSPALSAAGPSSLYLTLFVPGLERDGKAIFKLYNNAVKLLDARFNEKGTTVSFLIELADEYTTVVDPTTNLVHKFEPTTKLKRGTIMLGDAIRAAKSAPSEQLTEQIGFTELGVE